MATLCACGCGEAIPERVRKKPATYKPGHHVRVLGPGRWQGHVTAGARLNHVRRKYGLSREAYTQLVERAGGVCMICGGVQTIRGKTELAVDHDHATGEVRGLLCYHCNAGIGHFRDDPELLARAIRYLEKTHAGRR